MSESAGLEPIPRDSLTRLVYNNLRVKLMEGRFWPGHRFKIRQLASEMHVSETPIREALMQLVRVRALEQIDSRSIMVAHMTLPQYLELRTIRLFLEGMLAENATTLITKQRIDAMADYHDELIAAEKSGRWSHAVQANWHFHHTLYEATELTEALAILDDIWLRNGPLLNLQYPDAAPTYRGRHQHLNILEQLRKRNPEGVREAIKADMLEGGTKLVKLLEQTGGTRAMLSSRAPEEPTSVSTRRAKR